MENNKLRDLVKASNPVSTPSRLLPNDADVQALFTEITHRTGNPQPSADLLEQPVERRRDMQTQEKPIQIDREPKTPRSRRRLMPALAGAIAVIVIAVGVVALTGNKTSDVAGRTPSEVIALFNEAVVAGDWQAMRSLFSDAAQLEVYSAETGETFVEPQPLVDFVPFTSYDWDGDGSVNGFDSYINTAGMEHAAGTTTFVSCSQVDAVTAACELVSEGFAFLAADYESPTWTFTIVDGLITNVREDHGAGGFLYDTNRTFGYNTWVVENRPELERELFDDIVTLAISPDTVSVHRELVAEWQAQQ